MRKTSLILTGCLLAGGLFGQPSSAVRDSDDDLRRVAGTIQAVGGALSDMSRAANRNEFRDDQAGCPGSQTIRKRTASQSMAIVTAGATAGASIGASTRKGTQAVVAGAIIGGIAGLIFEQVTAHRDGETPRAQEMQNEPAPASPQQ